MRPAEVRARDEAHLLEICHDVADARGREVEPGIFGQGARADRLAVGDVALHQRFQQQLGAFVERGDVGGHAFILTKKQ